MLHNTLFLYTTTVLTWGCSWIFIKLQLGTVEPALSVAYRFALAAFILHAWCMLRRTPMRLSAQQHVALVLFGFFLFGANYVIFYEATAFITSGLLAVLFSTIIVMNTVNAFIFYRTPVTLQLICGGICGLAGIGLIFWHDIKCAVLSDATCTSLSSSLSDSAQSFFTPLPGDTVILGIVLGLVATYLASLGNMVAIFNQRHGVPVLQANAWGMLYGAVLTFIWVVLIGAPLQFEWTWSYTLSLLYLSIFASIIAFGAYIKLIHTIGASRAAYTTVMFPIVALFISTFLENWQWRWHALIGLALVLVGNIIILRKNSIVRIPQSEAKT